MLNQDSSPLWPVPFLDDNRREMLSNDHVIHVIQESYIHRIQNIVFIFKSQPESLSIIN